MSNDRPGSGFLPTFNLNPMLALPTNAIPTKRGGAVGGHDGNDIGSMLPAASISHSMMSLQHGNLANAGLHSNMASLGLQQAALQNASLSMMGNANGMFGGGDLLSKLQSTMGFPTAARDAMLTNAGVVSWGMPGFSLQGQDLRGGGGMSLAGAAGLASAANEQMLQRLNLQSIMLQNLGHMDRAGVPLQPELGTGRLHAQEMLQSNGSSYQDEILEMSQPREEEELVARAQMGVVDQDHAEAEEASYEAEAEFQQSSPSSKKRKKSEKSQKVKEEEDLDMPDAEVQEEEEAHEHAGKSSSHKSAKESKKSGCAGSGGGIVLGRGPRNDFHSALETLIGSRIYVHGTGGAKGVRKDGILCKVGDAVRVESEGTVMGLNDFCASAQNSKKRPRDCVRLADSGMSLKQATESMIGVLPPAAPKKAEGQRGNGKSGDAANLAEDREDESSDDNSSVKSDDEKEPSHPEVEEKAAAVVKKKESKLVISKCPELLASSHLYKSEEEVGHEYDRAKVDFTLVLPCASNKGNQSAAQEKHVLDMKLCLNMLKMIMNHKFGPLFCEPFRTAQESDVKKRVSQPIDLIRIKENLEEGRYQDPSEFSAHVRLIFHNAKLLYPQGSAMLDCADSVSQLFESKFDSIESHAVKENAETFKKLPAELKDVPQRFLDCWFIMDSNGEFLAPWHAGDASQPGGVFGLLLAAGPGKGEGGEGDSDSLEIRLEAPDEWHVQCLDMTGCKLPQFWIRGDSHAGPVWYQLGSPLEMYRPFLRRECTWLMASYRICSFLQSCPKASYEEVCEVLAGKNWKSGGKKLRPLVMDLVLDRADKIVEEVALLNPKLTSHRFLLTLLARQSKYLRRKFIRTSTWGGQERGAEHGETSSLVATRLILSYQTLRSTD